MHGPAEIIDLKFMMTAIYSALLSLHVGWRNGLLCTGTGRDQPRLSWCPCPGQVHKPSKVALPINRALLIFF